MGLSSHGQRMDTTMKLEFIQEKLNTLMLKAYIEFHVSKSQHLEHKELELTI